MLYLHIAALLAGAVTAATTPEAPQTKPLKMDFSVLRGNSWASAVEGEEAYLVKRDGQTELELANEQTFYAAKLKVGSHGAENTVVVDTGSSDLWIMSSDVRCVAASSSLSKAQAISRRRLMDFEIDEPSPSQENNKRADRTITLGGTQSATRGSNSGGGTCTSRGSFNTGDSGSFHYNTSAPNFSISYADGTFATGFWGTDYVDFGPLNVSDCSIAIVNRTSSDIGVFGIGFPELEVTYSGSSSSRAYTYENFPLRLKSTGAIKKLVYSLYLNSASASSGSILFGAVDHAKYSGQLQTVPIVNIYSGYFRRPIRFDIVLDSLVLGSSSQNVTVSTSRIPALLDSGTTLSYFPSQIVSNLASALGASMTSQGYYRLSCSYNSRSAFATFTFSGVEIKVPIADLILSTGSTCYLGVLPQSADSLTGAPYAILGDNFLRSAYVVYNLEDYEISLAQANYTNDENIEVVSGSIPLAVQAASYSATALATSINSGSSSSHLSSSGWKKSEGSSGVHFAKALLFSMIGMCVVLVL